MRLSKPILALISAVAVGALSTACIVACNDIACNGGLEWTGRAAEGVLTPGAYSVELTVEDDVYTIDCQLTESYADSECEAPVHVSGEVDYIVDFSFGQFEPESWDPQDPPADFYLYVVDRSEDEPSGVFHQVRGPTSVAIHIEHEGATLVDESYELEYERDEEFWGDPQCGYCDLSVTRESMW